MYNIKKSSLLIKVDFFFNSYTKNKFKNIYYKL